MPIAGVAPRRAEPVWKLHENQWRAGHRGAGRWRWVRVGRVGAVLGSVDRVGILGSTFAVFTVDVRGRWCEVVRVAGRWVVTDPTPGVTASFELRNCAIPALGERGKTAPLPS
jgi:hypothetical protein